VGTRPATEDTPYALSLKTCTDTNAVNPCGIVWSPNCFAKIQSALCGCDYDKSRLQGTDSDRAVGKHPTNPIGFWIHWRTYISQANRFAKILLSVLTASSPKANHRVDSNSDFACSAT